jgi:RNA polymerase sigma-70 factor, ECF subfamily
MDDFQKPVKDERSDAPTLGDVLYASNSGPLVLEAEWVALIRSIAAGDQLAMLALYNRAGQAVFTFIAGTTGDRAIAEKLTLEAFCAVWRTASTYDPGSTTVLGWVMEQARSQANDWLRTEHQKVANVPLSDFKASLSNDLVRFSEQSRTLRCALANLDSNERQAIEAAVYCRLTYAEVAKRMNQPLENVEAWIRSGLLKLDQVIQEANKI